MRVETRMEVRLVGWVRMIAAGMAVVAIVVVGLFVMEIVVVRVVVVGF